MVFVQFLGRYYASHSSRMVESLVQKLICLVIAGREESLGQSTPVSARKSRPLQKNDLGFPRTFMISASKFCGILQHFFLFFSLQCYKLKKTLSKWKNSEKNAENYGEAVKNGSSRKRSLVYVAEAFPGSIAFQKNVRSIFIKDFVYLDIIVILTG